MLNNTYKLRKTLLSKWSLLALLTLFLAGEMLTYYSWRDDNIEYLSMSEASYTCTRTKYTAMVSYYIEAHTTLNKRLMLSEHHELTECQKLAINLERTVSKALALKSNGLIIKLFDKHEVTYELERSRFAVAWFALFIWAGLWRLFVNVYSNT